MSEITYATSEYFDISEARAYVRRFSAAHALLAAETDQLATQSTYVIVHHGSVCVTEIARLADEITDGRLFGGVSR